MTIDTETFDLKVGSGVNPTNTERATLEGLKRMYNLLRREYPEISQMEAELLCNVTRSDWAAGREEVVKKRLEGRFGVLFAAMLLANLLAGADTGFE